VAAQLSRVIPEAPQALSGTHEHLMEQARSAA
jgi:hypothetical protein